MTTAEEFYKYHNHGNYRDFDKTTLKGKDVKEAMVKFAQMHVKAAIKEQIRAEHDSASEVQINLLTEDALNHNYPLSKIK